MKEYRLGEKCVTSAPYQNLFANLIPICFLWIALHLEAVMMFYFVLLFCFNIIEMLDSFEREIHVPKLWKFFSINLFVIFFLLKLPFF